VGTFSKLIGPGVKVGWLQADARLLKRMAAVGYVETPGMA
jgi:DNA-binding transcriptional MocR family regulator